MKALALTVLTIFACLILANLLFATPSADWRSVAVPPAKAVAVEFTATQPAHLPVVTVVAAAKAEKNPSQNVPVSSGDVLEPTLAAAVATATEAVPVVEVAPMVTAISEQAVYAPVAVKDAKPENIVASAQVSVPDNSQAASAPAAVADVAQAAEPSVSRAFESPQSDAFAANMTNGQAAQVVGIFVQDQFALPVIQQPDGQTNFVSTQNNTVTQFNSASLYGTIGLLAHNFLSGRLFFNLKQDQDVIIVYGDGRQEDYRITSIQSYQALDPSNPYSYFMDPNDPSHTQITAGALFNRIYAHPDQVVLQTCIDANGNSSWGRLFITATKVQ
jgi:hypothetical protein